MTLRHEMLAHYAARAKKAILDMVDDVVCEQGDRDKIRRVVLDSVELLERRVWDDARCASGAESDLHPHH